MRQRGVIKYFWLRGEGLIREGGLIELNIILRSSQLYDLKSLCSPQLVMWLLCQ